MLWNVVNPPKNPSVDDISSLSTAQTLELCDPEVLLQEPLQNSEVTSTSNCCYQENISISPDIINQFPTYFDKNSTEITSATNGCCLFDNDFYVPKDFSMSTFTPPFPNNYQEDHELSLLPSHESLLSQEAVVNGLPNYPHDDHFPPVVEPTIMPSFLEEGCLMLDSCMRLSSFLGSAINTVGPYLQCNLTGAVLSDDDNSGIFNGLDYVGTSYSAQNQDLELQGDNGGIFCSDSLPGIFEYSSHVLQASLSNERQHGVNDGTGSSIPLDSDISSLEESAFKAAAAKCSVEERKDKIHRYLKKRNERNFSKKIKYACRKTLADKRLRVRGRFAKNDEFVFHENLIRGSWGHNEEDTHVLVEEDDRGESSNIYAHLSGVDSFKCNHPTQSNWI